MLFSAVLSAVFLVGIIGIAVLVRMAVTRRASALVGTVTGSSGGVPLLLYFTTPGCTVCRVQQEPALQRLQEHLGNTYHVRTVDVSLEPDEARRYRVMTAPTIVVLDGQGTVRAVNVGFTSDDMLAAQIRNAA